MYKYVILTLLNDVITFLTSLKCNYNGKQVIYIVFFQFQIPIIMQRSYVSPAPWGWGIAGLLYFSNFKALLKALHCGAKFVVKFLLEAPSPGIDNNATDICIHHDVLLQENLALGSNNLARHSIEPRFGRIILVLGWGFDPCLTTIHMKGTFNPGSL